MFINPARVYITLTLLLTIEKYDGRQFPQNIFITVFRSRLTRGFFL